MSDNKVPPWLWKKPPAKQKLDKSDPLQKYLENPFVDEDEEIVELFVPAMKNKTYRFHQYHIDFLKHTADSLNWSQNLLIREILDLYMTATGHAPEVDKYHKRVSTVRELRQDRRFKKLSPSTNTKVQDELAERRAKRQEDLAGLVRHREKKRLEKNAKAKKLRQEIKDAAKDKGRGV